MTAFPGKRGSLQGAVPAILWGGLIAGTIDIAAAIIPSAMQGGQPLRMLQGIAYALIGPGAFKGGWGTAGLGLALHFVIALGSAALYYGVSRVLPVMMREPVVCGLLYGVPVWMVTNFVIVPLSRIGRPLPGTPAQCAVGLMVLMIGVGLPIGLATRRYGK